MMKDRITVIVPIYNAESCLLKCVESIRNQTHADLEIILIDDGSTDGSGHLLGQLAKKDARIQVYHTENKGSVAARKYGLARAEGAYIGFVDADDYIEPEMFAKLLRCLKQNDADFVHTGYVEESEGTRLTVCEFEEETAELTDISEKIRFIQKYLLKEAARSLVSPSLVTKLYKAEFIKECFKHLPEEQQYGEDLLCLWRCILESRRIVLHKSAMYHYVIRNNSLSHMPYDMYMMREIGLWHHLIKLAEEYKCLETLKKDLYGFLKRRMVSVLLADEKSRIPIPHYYYRDMERLKGKRIVLYGAGDVGQDYYAQISRHQSCEIIEWVDSNWRKYRFDDARVTQGSEAVFTCCDIILIAVREEKTAKEIESCLKNIGVSPKRIAWQEPGTYY